MKNFSSSTNGVRDTYTYYSDGSVDHKTTLLRKQYESVVSGAMISNPGSDNPWSFDILVDKSIEGQVTGYFPSYTQLLIGTLASSSGIIYSSELDYARNQAFRKFTERLYGQIDGEVNLAVTIGESSRGKLKGSIQGTIQAADNVRRQAGHYGVKTVGKAWLAAQYLWKPLVSDIYNVVSEVSNQVVRKDFKISASATHVEPIDHLQTMFINGVSFPKVRVTGTASARVKACYKMRVNGQLDTLARMTSLDPAVIAWELLPYSFVVDWFYNIGGYLSQLETRARYSSAIRGGYITRTQKVDANFHHSGKDTTGKYFSGMGGTVSRKQLTRQVTNAFPQPVTPQFECDLGAGTLLNAAALLASKLSF